MHVKSGTRQKTVHPTACLVTFLQLLCERPKVGSRNFHFYEVTCLRVEDSLLDDICLERALGGTHGVATTVARGTLFAGHLTDSGHKAA